MESPFLQPGFLLTLALAIIAFITWLVKLERRNAVLERDQTRLENDIEKLTTHFENELKKQEVECETQLKEMRLELRNHLSNTDIHFNIKVSEQVEKRNDLKFGQIDGELKTLHQQMEKGFEDVGRKLDKLAGKA